MATGMQGTITYDDEARCWRVRIETGPNGRHVDFPLHLTLQDSRMWRRVERGLPIHRALAAGADSLKDMTLMGAFR